MLRLRRTGLAIASLAACHSVSAATIVGTARGTGGQAVRGALITLYSADELVSETVYSDATGHYRLATSQQGKLQLRARAPLLADQRVTLAVPPGEQLIEQSFTMQALGSAQAISDSLPASAHFVRIKFPTRIAREQFQTDCLSCHQIGNPFTRAARTPEQWSAIVRLMLTYAGYSTQLHLTDYSSALQHAFDGTPTPANEPTRMASEVLGARITEWKLPGAVIAHDAEFNPADGKYYTVDQGVDRIYVTDPVSNTTKIMPLPAGGVPVGGRFAERGLPIPFGLTVHHGVHSLQFGPDGRLYITAAIGGEIGVFDTRSGSYQAHRLGGTSLYPHTLRFDARGIVWFTIAQSNQIGRFDPKTGSMKIIELPHDMARQDERQPLPYGIDISPVDGSIWYSKLWANKLGRIDSRTLEVREFEPPMVGPRRLRFDARGALWIPGFGDGTLVRLDTRTMQYKSYRIPGLGPDEVEAPYAVAVDPRTQDVWITANMSDRVFRFVQSSGRFLAYPLPSRGSYFRDFFFPADGSVCAPSSPMPPRPAVVEGGEDAIVCIKPAGTSAGPARHGRIGVAGVNRPQAAR